jgi:hypothetical protein
MTWYELDAGAADFLGMPPGSVLLESIEWVPVRRLGPTGRIKVYLAGRFDYVCNFRTRADGGGIPAGLTVRQQV